MPWVRVDENAMDHPKVSALADGAFRLWIEGLSFCQKHLTDGWIGLQVLRGLRYYSPSRLRALTTVLVPGKSPLWDPQPDGGVVVHDYLVWNESREQVMYQRESAMRRVSLLRDPELRERIKARDGNDCRYCGLTVNWKDRRGSDGGTYDHVDPTQGNTLENVVVSCRGCNSRKGKRTPEGAGMPMRPAPRFRSDLSRDLSQTKPVTCGVVLSSSSQLSQGREGGLGETSLTARAGSFCEWYAEAHERFIGVGYIGPYRDYEHAQRLCEKFTDADLRDAAMVWFGQEDDWAKNGTRTIAKFASRASNCLLTARRVSA